MLHLARVAGHSMAPTYHPSDLLLTRPVGREGRGLSRGDVVVLRHAGALVVKRVVGVPGDVVELEAGRLLVAGAAVDGRPRLRGARTATWRVPAGHWFVAGDDPAVSDDSRVWADPFVAGDDVEAVVVGRLPRWGPRRVVRRRRPGAAGHPAG